MGILSQPLMKFSGYTKVSPVKAKWVTIKIEGKMSGRRSLEGGGKACCLAAGEAKDPEAVNHTRIQLTLSIKKKTWL